MPKNANLSSEASDKCWLEIRDGARGKASSNAQLGRWRNKTAKWQKGPGFLPELLIKFWPDADWVWLSTRDSQPFPVIRGLKDH